MAVGLKVPFRVQIACSMIVQSYMGAMQHAHCHTVAQVTTSYCAVWCRCVESTLCSAVGWPKWVHFTPLVIVVLVSVALGLRDLASHGWRVGAPPINLFTGFGAYGVLGILKDAYKLEFPLSLLAMAVAGLVGVLGQGKALVVLMLLSVIVLGGLFGTLPSP